MKEQSELIRARDRVTHPDQMKHQPLPDPLRAGDAIQVEGHGSRRDYATMKPLPLIIARATPLRLALISNN